MLQTLIRKTPVPIAGLMLALASMGNLLVRHSVIIKNVLGALALTIALLILLKLFFNSKLVIQELNNPIALSVAPTFCMGLMILSTYLKPYASNLAYSLWLVAILSHFLIMLIFTRKYIINFKLNKVFATYFIVFVGVVVASVTARAFNMAKLGQYIFGFGLASYFVLLPIILYRVYVLKGIPDPAKPTIAILAAPASLCLAGYLSSFDNINLTVFYCLLMLSIVFALWIILNIPRLLKAQFYASYSALTFPFAITAIALRKATAFASKANLGLAWLSTSAQFAEIFAVTIIGYVFVRYFLYYIQLNKEVNLSNNAIGK